MRSGRSLATPALIGGRLPAQGVWSAFNVQRAALIADMDGDDGGGGGASGWNTAVRDSGVLEPKHVTRISDTVVHIDFTPAIPAFDISATETVTSKAPAASVVGGVQVTGDTFTVTATATPFVFAVLKKRRRLLLRRREMTRFPTVILPAPVVSVNVVLNRPTRINQKAVSFVRKQNTITPSPPAPPPPIVINKQRKIEVRRSTIQKSPDVILPQPPTPIVLSRPRSISQPRSAVRRAPSIILPSPPAPPPPIVINKQRKIEVRRSTIQRAATLVPQVVVQGEITIVSRPRYLPAPVRQILNVTRSVVAAKAPVNLSVVLNRPRSISQPRSTVRRAPSIILPTVPPADTFVVSRPRKVQYTRVSLVKRTSNLILPPPPPPIVINKTRKIEVRRSTIHRAPGVVLPPTPAPPAAQTIITRPRRIEVRRSVIKKSPGVILPPPPADQTIVINKTRKIEVRKSVIRKSPGVILPPPPPPIVINKTRKIEVRRSTIHRQGPCLPQDPPPPTITIISRPRRLVQTRNPIYRAGDIIVPVAPSNVIISKPTRQVLAITRVHQSKVIVTPTVVTPGGPVVISRTRTLSLRTRGPTTRRIVVVGGGEGYNPPVVIAGGTSPADILGQWLINLAIGVDPDVSDEDWPVYFGHLPDEEGTPDNAIAIYDTGGTDDGRTMVDGVRAKHPGFQVRVRGGNYQTAWTKITEIEATMEGLLRTPVSRGGKTWLLENVSGVGTVISLGVEGDKLRRDHFTLNGLLTLSEV